MRKSLYDLISLVSGGLPNRKRTVNVRYLASRQYVSDNPSVFNWYLQMHFSICDWISGQGSDFSSYPILMHLWAKLPMHCNGYLNFSLKAGSWKCGRRYCSCARLAHYLEGTRILLLHHRRPHLCLLQTWNTSHNILLLKLLEKRMVTTGVSKIIWNNASKYSSVLPNVLECTYEDHPWSDCDPFHLTRWRNRRLTVGGSECQQWKNETKHCTQDELPPGTFLQTRDKWPTCSCKQ